MFPKWRIHYLKSSVPVGRPGFRGIEKIALIFRGNEYEYSFDLTNHKTERVCLLLVIG